MTNDIAGLPAKAARKRRPSVYTKIEADHGEGIHAYHNSGVELVLTRDGIECFGFYDTFVGIQGFRMSWAEFDAEREALK